MSTACGPPPASLTSSAARRAIAVHVSVLPVARTGRLAHTASDGKHEKMELLYRYLAGDQFRSRVEAIVEAFTTLQSELARERVAMERIWKQREKQIDRALTSTAGMYGELRGIVGATVPDVPALELESI